MNDFIKNICINDNSIIYKNLIKILDTFDILHNEYKKNDTIKLPISTLNDIQLYRHELFKYYDNNKLVISNLLVDNNKYELLKIYNKLILEIKIILSIDILDNTIINDISKLNFKNIKTELYPYQINNLNWMLSIEQNRYDDIYQDVKKQINFKGGGLFDEVGMGKTLQIITLINENISKYNKFVKEDKIYTKATLIIAPNHLCGQWVREIELHIIKPLNILKILTKHHYNKYTYFDFMQADIVIVSANYFENCKLNQNEKIDPLFNIINMFNKSVNLFNLYWHRTVIDEFHEIEDLNLFTKLKNMTSDYRWIVSGTPFKENIFLSEIHASKSSLANILDYLTLDEQLFIKLNFDDINLYNYIKNHFSRNTHNKNIKILKLPEIVEETHWLNFTDTERMIYNAYLADQNNTEYDIFLRQICCHPKISETMRENLSNKVNNLTEIQDQIKKMYFTDYDNSVKNHNELKERLEKNKLELKEYVDNDKTRLIGYKNLKEQYDINCKKLDQLKKIRDGKEKTLIYYKTFLELISDMEKVTTQECTICLDNIKEDDLGITFCGHIYCYSCISVIIKENKQSNIRSTCPLCSKHLDMNNIFLINNKVSSDINELGTKLAFIIKYIKETPTKYRIIFSQWDYLLKEVGKVLENNNIKHLYCQGNVYQKDKVLSLFNNKDNENNDNRIIMLSSDSTVSGSNLNNAEEVIFLDPVYGDLQHRINTESQAIGRVRRLGNKFEKIKVMRILIKDSIEEIIYNEQK